MAKSYFKGADYRLYRDRGDIDESELYEIKAVGDLAFNPNNDDVAVPERGQATGHLHGNADPELTFTLYEDKGDTDVEAMIDAVYSGDVINLVVIRGTAAQATKKYIRLEAVLTGSNTANRGDPGVYEVTARRHPTSEIGFTRGVVSEINQP